MTEKGKANSDKYSRRDALRALGKYSAYVGTTGVIVLSAEDVVAQSQHASCVHQCINDYLPGKARARCIRNCRRQERLNQLFND